jgi:hypothetical protein
MAAVNHQVSRKIELSLWTAQAILSLLFLFAGGMKLVMPIEALTQQAPLPALFLRFIGVLEVLGGLGLILPGVLHLRADLTPLAAAGLIFVMCGAVGVSLVTGPLGPALVPVIVGCLAGFVAIGRWKVAPHRAATTASLVSHTTH